MKKLLTILFLISFLMSGMCYAQDIVPADSAMHVLPTYSFKYYTADSSVWIYKGAKYKTTKLARAKDGWYAKALSGTDTVYIHVEAKDTLNIAKYMLHNDSTDITGYATRGYVQRNFVAKNDSSKLYELKSNKVTSVSGASTDIQYPSGKLLYDALAGKQAILTNPVTGTGSAGQVTFWNGTSTQTGDNGFIWDNTNKRLGLGVIPGYSLDVSASGNSWINQNRPSTSELAWHTLGTGGSTNWGIGMLNGSTDLLFYDYSVGQVFTFKSGTGNTGFGYTDPGSYRIKVNGTGYFNDLLTAPSINLSTGAAVNYTWQCTNSTTGAGHWANITNTQTFISTWNASTNTPTLADGTGTNGYYHTVQIAGDQDLGSGSIHFEENSTVIYNGSIWQKLPAPSITGAALTKTDDTNVTLTLGGSPAISLVNAASITAGWTGMLADGRIASAVNWNTAYGWGNHASAGYGLASALSTHAGLTTTAHGLGASAFHTDNFSIQNQYSSAQTGNFWITGETKSDNVNINSTGFASLIMNSDAGISGVQNYIIRSGIPGVANGGFSIVNSTTGHNSMAIYPNDAAVFLDMVYAPYFNSQVATGTPPLSVTSTTLVTNLNADLLDGQHGSYYQASGNYVAVSDTSTMLSKYARKVSPTFTGTVVLPSTTSIGTITSTELGYVDGVTSAIQTQFSGKVDKETGKHLPDNNFTDADSTKLLGIAAGAEVNVNADWNAASGDAQILNKPSTIAPSAHTLDSHSNVTITSNASGEILKWNGSAWINNTLAEAGIQPAGTYSTGGGSATGTNTGDNAVNSNYSGLVTMTYPGAGIALSNGSAWETSITNNSANWNAAFGWGNHAGLYLPLSGGTLTGALDVQDKLYARANQTANNYTTAALWTQSFGGTATGIGFSINGVGGKMLYMDTDLKLYWDGIEVGKVNQNTTGSAGSTTSAVTFAATGGAAAGTTFNGSTAKTIDYNTIGAQVAGSYVIPNDSSKLYERKSNKVTSISSGSTDIQYPSAKLLYDQLAGKQAAGTYTTGGGTATGTNTGDQTLTIAGTTTPTIALSGSNTATFSAGTGITLGQSGGTITVTNSAPSSGGTVTSVVGGTGITGGTITTTGTLAIDTTVVAKKTTVAAMYQPKGSYLTALHTIGILTGQVWGYDSHPTSFATYGITETPWTSYLPLSGGTLTGTLDVQDKLYARANQTANNYTTAALWTQSYGGTATGIAFSISGIGGKMLYMDTDQKLYWAGVEIGNTKELPLTFGLGLSRAVNTVIVDTTLVWTPTRASHISSYPTLNQSTTGSAAKWTTKRKLFGRYIDGSANMDSVILDTYISSAATWNAKEPGLGNPGTNGYMLSSTTAGVRSWVTPQSGAAATIAVGTVTMGAAGSSVAITNEGSSSAATFNFTIPKGDTGATGPNNITTSTTTNGTGFVKGNGSVISFDNSTYLTSESDPTVNNATLTAAVSGSGLSISATPTFTANASANKTITITSNATATNTASTIVLRDASGNVSLTGTFCSSDSTLKRNIRPLSKVDLYNASKIDFVKFLYKSDATNQLHLGVVAQQVEKYVPEVVHTNEYGRKEVNYPEMLVIIAAQHAEEIKLLKEQNRQLEKRISKLENKNRWEAGQLIIQ